METCRLHVYSPPHPMRLPSALVLFTLVAAPARAQWEPVPLPASFETPSQVALFGFAQGFGDALFVSTGFGIPETPASIVYDLVFVTRDGGASWATVPEFTVDAATGGVKTGRPTVADGVLYLPRARATSTPPTETSTVLRTGDGLTWTAPAAAGLDPNDGVLLNVARQDGVLVGRSERAGGTNDVGYVCRSADDGATWARAGGTVPPRLTYSAASFRA